MRAKLHPDVLVSEGGQRAQQILRSCVQCGFCTATCPTYLETGNELDGPRGRINLMNLMLESNRDSTVALHHLDRCLSYQACETTCPSDVAYGELLQITRTRFARSTKRPFYRRWLRLWVAGCMALIWPGALFYRLTVLLAPWLGSRWSLPLKSARYRQSEQAQTGPGGARQLLWSTSSSRRLC